MKVGLVFHKNPLAPQSGIDLIRLKAIAGGLIRKGIETDVLAPALWRSTMLKIKDGGSFFMAIAHRSSWFPRAAP